MVVRDQTASITGFANLNSFAGDGALPDLVPLGCVAAVAIVVCPDLCYFR
jgi:hypothetical protein